MDGPKGFVADDRLKGSVSCSKHCRKTESHNWSRLDLACCRTRAVGLACMFSTWFSTVEGHSLAPVPRWSRFCSAVCVRALSLPGFLDAFRFPGLSLGLGFTASLMDEACSVHDGLGA